MSAEFGVRSSEYKNRAAFLWDESFLWGVMAYKALTAAGLPFELLRSEEIRKGRLKEYALLFVPGGWASNKLKALGDDGAGEIKRFVHEGGAYLGFCGGAGLATRDGLGLAPVTRRPTKERVPSFSGRIALKVSRHSLWQGVSDPVFHAWWPSQFAADQAVKVLATYGKAMPDSFSSDVNVGDAETAGSWQNLERLYRINLNPDRLAGEPAVIEAAYGKGTVLLSLLHFDTPDDPNGAAVLSNLWKYLIGDYAIQDAGSTIHDKEKPASCIIHRESSSDTAEAVSEIESAVDELISLGVRNFLWFRRNSLLLQWRRGVRGLEYCTLFVMVHELAELLQRQGNEHRLTELSQDLTTIRAQLLPFAAQAERLLVRERFALQRSPITYERCEDQGLQALRDELFSRSKSHGGRFKDLLDVLDRALYAVMIRA